jgi:tRNA(Arg) A34 adenosine deaminase TadA
MAELETLPMRIYHPGGEVEEGTYTPDNYDRHNMDQALDAAEKAGQAGDNAVGCAYVLPDGQVIVSQTREFRDQDLQGHAEQIGYRFIQPFVGRELKNTRLYTIAEPCYGCAYMLDKGSLNTLFLAANKSDAPEFFRNPDTLDHIWKKTRRTLKVVSGLRKSRALEILATYPKKH